MLIQKPKINWFIIEMNQFLFTFFRVSSTVDKSLVKGMNTVNAETHDS